MGGIHQFVPALLEGDATGGHVLEIRQLVRSFGLESDIYVETIDLGLAPREARHFSDYPKTRADGDVLLYHLAVASHLADFLYTRPEPLVIDYHNLTPAQFFRGWDPRAALYQVWGRAQVARLADRAVLALADSAFNQAELVELGYEDTVVVPILIDLDAFDAKVDEKALDRLAAAKADGGADLLFVGRISPNKAQHDLVKALLAYRRLYDSAARLHLVGRPQSPVYLAALRRYVSDLGLSDSVDLAEGVSQAELAAYYRAADVLVSCSEHEGFCVPLLEAMHQGVPVVAYGAAAVPETLGPGGIVLASKAPLVVAAAIDRVIHDARLRSGLVAAGRRRLADFSPERTRGRLVEALGRFLPGDGGSGTADAPGSADQPAASGVGAGPR
ncbi:MAG: hypothetical protein DLM54_07450 [Acidimicrobiales bacterium]|nr:MAG: hypothetical protein DLM54_07450 [Acidimicrobiales bacterium]